MSVDGAVRGDGVEGWVVLVPGLGLDARVWARVWPLLTGPSTVVTLPSMGRPASRGTDLGVEALADRLVANLPARGRLLLVGHSASCQVVVEAAVRQPRVEGLVLIGPTTDPAAAGWPRTLERWLRTACHERVWEAPVLAPQYRRTGPLTMAAGMDRIRRHRVDDSLASVSAPVVVVGGEYDRIAPERWCAHLAAISGGPVRTVPGGAHMLPLTHPAAVAAAVAWLGREASGRSWRSRP